MTITNIVSADFCRRCCNTTTCHYFSPLTFPGYAFLLSPIYTHSACQSSLRYKMSKHIEQNHDEARSSFISYINRDHFLQECCVLIAPVCFLRHCPPLTADIYSCPPTQFPCLRLQEAVIF